MFWKNLVSIFPPKQAFALQTNQRTATNRETLKAKQKHTDPKSRKLSEDKFRSQLADQICYAVLCVFSYVAAGQGELAATGARGRTDARAAREEQLTVDRNE